MPEREFGYKPPIPKELQTQYEAALGRVLRWKNGNWEDNIHETVVDHVAGMFIVLEDINKSCPTLSSDIDTETARHMIYLHDAGEILTEDLTHNRDDYHELHDRWKFRERSAFRLLTRQIEDKEVKLKVRQLHDRCFAQRQDDKEALLTEFIDKDQGSRFGYRNVFHGRGMTAAKRQMQMNHTMNLLLAPASNLLKLVSPQTQIDLKNFLLEELERFSQYGYGREAAFYIKSIDSLLGLP